MSRIHLPARKNDTKRGSAGKGPGRKTRGGSKPTGTNADGTPGHFHKKASSRIFHLLKEEDWLKARTLIREELETSPNSHWLWMVLGHTYYERHDYEKALPCAEHAVALQPQCPLALFYYAGALEMLGRDREALAVFQKILDREPEELAYGECGEGLARAMQIQNDAHYRMSQCYLRLGESKAAHASLQKHLHNRSHGVRSTYPMKKAKELLLQASQ